MSTCKRCGKETTGMPFHTCLAKPTNDQLKQALAKMLPNRLAVTKLNGLIWINKGRDCESFHQNVLDTELLHICWMVEETLNADERLLYLLCFWDLEQSRWEDQHATWQEKVPHLAKVKGIEL